MIIKYILVLCWGGAKCGAIKARGSLGQDKIDRRKDKSLIYLEVKIVMEKLNPQIREYGQEY